jgi:hypothetical protein
VTGIETSAGLDPNDVTAFITGLTFVSNGSFTGTMTPIKTFIPDGSPVPEPSTMLLLGFGLVGLAGVARKKNEKIIRQSIKDTTRQGHSFGSAFFFLFS